MKKYFLSAVCLISLGLLLSISTLAQDKSEKEKEKSEKEKSDKEKVKAYDEIIIRKKTDKDAKVTIEMKDGEIKVNGKPIEDYEDENVVVRRSRTPRLTLAGPSSRFRSEDGSWNMEDNDGVFSYGGNKAFLGVTSEEEDGGAKITNVTEGSGAAKAGLKEGDVIIRIDDKKIEDPEDLTKAIGKYKPEDKVTVTYKRDGKENKTSATLGKNKALSTYSYSFPRAQVAPHITIPNENWDFDLKGDMPGQFYAFSGRPRIGIKAQDTEEGKGAKVLSVSKESAADKAGIKEGDIITEFDGKEVKDADELAEAAQDAREKSSVKVKLLRDGKAQTIEIKTPKKLKTANL